MLRSFFSIDVFYLASSGFVRLYIVSLF